MTESKEKVSVAGVGTYRLITNTGCTLDLLYTLYIPTFSRNLISVSKLDNLGYAINFGSNCCYVCKDNCVIGNGILIDIFYKICLDDVFIQSLYTVHSKVGIKRANIDDNSAYLWHKRFGHISKDRIQRLVKNKVLPNLDFTDFGTCIDCIKGKQTKKLKKGATRSSQLLEIIHTDICDPFDVPSFSKDKYFITFIDDYSRYGFIYLLHEKSQSVDALKIFITEVERQLERKVKIIRFDRGGQYYGKNDDARKARHCFAIHDARNTTTKWCC
jgi:GAG-pre-integrase domain/Integrase core domain